MAAIRHEGWVDRLGERAADASLRHPVLVTLALTAVTLGLAAGVPRLEVETSIQSILSEDHPFIVTTNEVVGTFGTHLPLIVSLDAGREVTAEDIEAVTPFFESLEALPHADRVAHAGNTPVMRGTGEGLELVPMIEAAAGEALAYPLIGRKRQSLAATVYVIYKPGRDDEDAYELYYAFRKLVAERGVPDGWKLRVAGLVSIYWEARTRIQKDMVVFMGLALALMILLLMIMYRRLSAVVAPLGVVVLTQVWTYGAMGWIGLPINLAATLLPAIIVVVGVADALHFLNQIAHARALRPDDPAETWVRAAARQVGLPCLLTTVTTMGGFLSLATSAILPIRFFGLMAGMAVCIALILTFTALPVLMRRFPPAPTPKTPLSFDPVPAILGVTRSLLRRPRLMLVIWATLGVAAAISVTSVRVDTGFDALFPKTDPVSIDQRWVEDRLFGSDVLGMRWRAVGDERLDDAATLDGLLALSSYLDRLPEVETVIGLPNFLDDLRRGLTEGEQTPAWSRPLAAQLSLLLEQADPELIGRFATEDRRQGVLIVQVDTLGAESMKALVKRTNDWVAAHDLPGRIDLFGPVFMFQQLVFTVVESLVRSFGLALLMVFVFVSLGVRSARLGLLGMIPNLAPIIAAGGVMGLLGITLNDQTVMVFSVGIGIAVDDTIHMLVAWRRRREAGLDPDAAVQDALNEVGPALVATSVVLGAGFGIGLLSSFAPPRTFSGLATLIVVVALLADLLLLTVLLARRKRV